MFVCLSLIGGIVLLNSGCDLLVELQNFIHSFVGLYTWLFVHDSSFKIQGVYGINPVDHLEGRRPCSSAWCLVISKLSMWEKKIPRFSIGLNQSPQESFQGYVCNLGLAISLWMACGAVFEFGSHFLSQNDPKVAEKLGITIRNNGPWNTM